MNGFRTLLIIPCYNEEDSIEILLQEINRLDKGYETIVIDDGSSDKTFETASPLSPTLKLPQNLGIGGAVQTGFQYAHRQGFDFCVQIDGDGQHPPQEVDKLIQAYIADPHSIIIGSRYINNDTFRSTWTRRLGSSIIAQALNLLFENSKISDPTSGMRLMDRKTIELFSKHYPHDFPEPISLAWALRKKLSIKEIPVNMLERQHGKSSILGIKTISYMFRVLSYIFLAKFVHITPTEK